MDWFPPNLQFPMIFMILLVLKKKEKERKSKGVYTNPGETGSV